MPPGTDGFPAPRPAAVPGPEVRSRRTLVAILLAGAALLAVLALSGLPARADDDKKEEKKPDCEMTFNLKGWSAFYKTASGEGTITCAGGGSLKVKITAKGGGITFGKSEVIGGKGRFYGAKNAADCLGSYAQSEAHAGAGKSSDAQALTKGDINLTLVGTGKGVDVGFAFGKFTIEKG